MPPLFGELVLAVKCHHLPAGEITSNRHLQVVTSLITRMIPRNSTSMALCHLVSVIMVVNGSRWYQMELTLMAVNTRSPLCKCQLFPLIKTLTQFKYI